MAPQQYRTPSEKGRQRMSSSFCRDILPESSKSEVFPCQIRYLHRVNDKLGNLRLQKDRVLRWKIYAPNRTFYQICRFIYKVWATLHKIWRNKNLDTNSNIHYDILQGLFKSHLKQPYNLTKQESRHGFKYSLRISSSSVQITSETALEDQPETWRRVQNAESRRLTCYPTCERAAETS